MIMVSPMRDSEKAEVRTGEVMADRLSGIQDCLRHIGTH